MIRRWRVQGSHFSCGSTSNTPLLFSPWGPFEVNASRICTSSARLSFLHLSNETTDPVVGLPKHEVRHRLLRVYIRKFTARRVDKTYFVLYLLTFSSVTTGSFSNYGIWRQGGPALAGFVSPVYHLTVYLITSSWSAGHRPR